MANLFKKAAVFTDLHLGLKGNSQQHNEDCLNFIKWMTKTAKEHGCETCLFLGDYHNNRASINIVTLNYSLRALEHLNDNFDQVYFIPGNHDLYYRDRRDVQSVEWARHLPRVQIVNDWFEQDDVVIAPWLVGDDHKRILKMSAKYCFGHFELPGYLMNAMVAMPDHGEVRREHFTGFEHVFTGHFHKRQTQRNITYIGNCFPHNYADAGDDLRGLMILEWGQEPEFHAWPDQPVYRVYDLSTVLDDPAAVLKQNTHARINLNIDITYEEAGFLRDTFMNDYGCREIKLIPNTQADLENQIIQGNITFQSVDQIVNQSLTAIESTQYNRNLLLEIYKTL
jgi:DNA repair exonuclease SbcCD nuclease subunit